MKNNLNKFILASSINIHYSTNQLKLITVIVILRWVQFWSPIWRHYNPRAPPPPQAFVVVSLTKRQPKTFFITSFPNRVITTNIFFTSSPTSPTSLLTSPLFHHLPSTQLLFRHVYFLSPCRGSIPGRGKISFSYLRAQTGSGATKPPIQ
jgi:hypothetical protein